MYRHLMILICSKLVMKKVPTTNINHLRHAIPDGIHCQEGTRKEVSTTFLYCQELGKGGHWYDFNMPLHAATVN